MALQFISGSSVCGRTKVIYETICAQAYSHPDNRYLFLVPEQQTLQVQRELAAIHPAHVLGNIDVLSFARLAHRVLTEQGISRAALLDDTGKSMILRRIAGKEREGLEILGRNLGQSGFIRELKSVISEFSAYRVTAQVLEEVRPSLSDRPALAKKLGDLGRMYSAFCRELGDTYRTAEELMCLLAEHLPQSEPIHNSIVILDGFTGFTPLQYQVLEALLASARHVVCALTDQEDGGRPQLFAMSRQMKSKLTQLAEKQGVSCQEEHHRYIRLTQGQKKDISPELVHLERQLFSHPVKAWKGEPRDIHICKAANPAKELEFVLRKTLELIRRGYCYRDIAVIAGDLSVYSHEAGRLFARAGIPFFIDQKKELTGNPLVQLVKEALAVVEEDMSYDAVMAFLRNPFISAAGETGEASAWLTVSALDRLDNYLLAGGIEGAGRWKQDWVFPYDGADEKTLFELNAGRRQIYGWFEPLREVTGPGHTVREAMTALFLFLQSFDVYGSLKRMCRSFANSGESYLESEYSQVYGKVMGLFDQIVELMGEQQLSIGQLREILDSGFEELRVGFIPAAVDRLVIGDPVRTRLEHIRVLFVVGANDGLLPPISDRGGLLTDYDREILREQGISLALSAREEAFHQQYYLYLLLTRPSGQLYLSYSECGSDGKALRPAHMVSVLQKLFPDCLLRDVQECYPGLLGLTGREDGFELLTRGIRESLDGGGQTWWQDLYSFYFRQEDYAERLAKLREALFYAYRTEKLDKAIAARLFCKEQESSITRLEKYAACAYAHFLAYGLRLRERSRFELQATDYGSLFHAAVSNFFGLLEKRGLDWRELEDGQRSALTAQSVAKTLEEYPTAIFDSSARNLFMAERIRRMTDRTLWALGYQWEQGAYQKTFHETEFGRAKGNAVRLSPEAGLSLSLAGRIDRVDVAEESGKLYVKVIDYKSGSTKLDINKIYYGLQLQLVLYLEAALQLQEKRLLRQRRGSLGEAADVKLIPAGIYYYNMKDPMVEGFGLSDEQIREKQLKELRMNGLTNEEERAVRLIDEQGGRVVTGLEFKKDGSLSSRALTGDTSRMKALCRYGRRKAEELARGICSGRIAPDPYEYRRQTPCMFCEYQSVCGFDLQTKGCHYRRLEDTGKEQIWERITDDEKEDSDGGFMDEGAASGH